MDSDDVCSPDRFAKQVAYLDAHPGVVALGGAYEMIDDAGRVFHVMRYPDDDAALQESSLGGRPALCHPLVMMRADAVARVGGYDESFPVAQDNDLWLRLGEVGQLACLPDVILQYRQHGGSVSEAKAGRQIEGLRRGCESACRRRGINRALSWRRRLARGWVASIARGPARALRLVGLEAGRAKDGRDLRVEDDPHLASGRRWLATARVCDAGRLSTSRHLTREDSPLLTVTRHACCRDRPEP